MAVWSPWITDELTRASESPEFAGAFETVHRWRTDVFLQFGSDSAMEMPPEVAVARASLDRIRLEAMERAGARFQEAVDRWRLLSLRGQPLQAWLDAGYPPMPYRQRERLAAQARPVEYEGTWRAHADWTACGDECEGHRP